jgi:DNA-binding IclR family transcriptional regulator
MEIGLRMLEDLDLRLIARPYMEQLAQDVEESIYLNILSKTDSIIIERVDSPLKVRIIDNLGERIPLTIGAANKTLLASMPDEQVAGILAQLDLNQETKTKLWNQRKEVAHAGYAISYGEKTEGTASIAAPIIGYHHQTLGALSIGVLNHNITEERLNNLINQVKHTAQQISIHLGKTT